MEIKELMIGNWVKSKDGAEKIVNINDYGYPSVQTKSTTKDGMTITDRYLEDIEPIPLTPEILEKNGFKKDDIGYWLFGEDYLIRYFFNLFEFKIERRSGNKPLTIFDGMLLYVHQLQNALTLCGIDKKIVL